MSTSGRSRALLPVVFVLAGVLVGFFVMRGGGDDDNRRLRGVETEDSGANCRPVARADAAATRPGETVLIDVLANDTDADGDSLVFQILRTDGGSSEIDDGDTPTDSADDRLAFTPADPPVETAAVEYQALDPQGRFSTGNVTVAVNADAALPEGVRSALASDPAEDDAEAGRCGDTVDTTTSSTLEVGPVGPETEVVTPTTTIVEDDNDSPGPTVRRRTATTRRPTANRPTTTRRPSSGGGTPGPTAPPPTSGGGGGTPTTDAPSVTAPPDTAPPATNPPTTQAPSDDTCGSPNPSSPSYNPDFEQCIRDNT